MMNVVLSLTFLFACGKGDGGAKPGAASGDTQPSEKPTIVLKDNQRRVVHDWLLTGKMPEWQERGVDGNIIREEIAIRFEPWEAGTPPVYDDFEQHLPHAFEVFLKSPTNALGETIPATSEVKIVEKFKKVSPKLFYYLASYKVGGDPALIGRVFVVKNLKRDERPMIGFHCIIQTRRIGSNPDYNLVWEDLMRMCGDLELSNNQRK